MNTTSRFNRDMLRRYERPGPRYTSYPTAPQFKDSFGAAQFREQAARSNETAGSLSLYLHIPYCSSPCFYCGCNRLITRDPVKGEIYLARLLREIERVAPLFDRTREVLQVHFGGGTPNFLSPPQLGQVLDCLDHHFHLSASAQRDFSIELDPRYIGDGDIAALAALGLNRASLGVQDFNPDVQQAINRQQDVGQTLSVIEQCRTSGMRSVNVDLIYGLPRQTPQGFEQTLHTVIDARPDRLAIYGYAHLPRMFKAQRQINDHELPDAEGRLALLQLAVEGLTSAGYQYIGMDHFALPQDDLASAQAQGGLHRNFMGYTTHADCDLIGLGVSAISRVGNSFSQNQRDLRAWEAAIDQQSLPVWRGLALSDDDRIRADVIQQLMCQGRIGMTDTEGRHGIDFHDYFASCWPRLEQLASDGLLQLQPTTIEATAEGRYLLRIIAMCFDRYLSDSLIDGTRYSKAI